MTEEQILTDTFRVADPAEREAFLDRACAGQPELRQRIEGRLALAAEQAPPAGADVATRRITTRPKDELGFLAPASIPGSLGRLRHYEITSVIGRGGMGVVLKAFDGTLQRPVAVKVMSVGLVGDAEARQRFVREARAAAAVSHDNVVAIHEVESDGPLPYLVLEFVAGHSLQALLEKQGPMPVTEIVRIGTQIARGLEAAHRRGLVHRDIKPANILVEEGTGRVKITDFGLARRCDAVALTQSGFILGSPLYMSPEQAEGKEVDQRSDLFSLGSVLYALCTGQAPFEGNTNVAVIRRVCDVQPQPIRERNPAIPARLEAIIAKLLAKNVSERYQTAGAVIEALEHHSPARPEKHALAFGGWLSRAALALLLLACGGWIVHWTLGRPSPDAAASKDGAKPGPTNRALREDATRPPARYAFLPAHPIVIPLQVNPVLLPPGCIPRCYSRDGAFLVTVGERDKVRVWETASGSLRAELPGNGTCQFPAFNAAGTLLAVREGESKKNVATLWDTKTLRVSKRIAHLGHVETLEFSHDGKLLAVATATDAILWDLTRDVEVARFAPFTRCRGVALDAGARRLAVSDVLLSAKRGPRWAQDSRVSVWDVDPASPTFKERLQQWEAPDNGYSDAIRFVPGTDRLIFCRASEGRIVVVVADWKTGAVVHELQPAPREFRHVMLGPLLRDNKTLVTLLKNDGPQPVQFWDIAQGKLLRSFPVLDTGDYSHFAVDPAGETLAVGGRGTQQLHFFDIATGNELTPSPRALR